MDLRIEGDPGSWSAAASTDLVAAILDLEQQSFQDASAALDRSGTEPGQPAQRPIRLAAVACGIARAALRLAVQSVSPAQSEQQGTQTRLADMATATEGAWLLTLQAASRGSSDRFEYDAAIAQTQALRAALESTSSAISLAGSAALAPDNPFEALARAARRCETEMGGCDDARRLLARALLQR